MHPSLVASVCLLLFTCAISALAQDDGGAPEYEYSVELVKDIWPGEDSSKLHGFMNYKGKVSWIFYVTSKEITVLFALFRPTVII